MTLYLVIYSAGSFSSQNWTSKTSLNITGLQPGTTYTVEVYARNSVGESKPVISTVRTGEAITEHFCYICCIINFVHFKVDIL